MYRRQVTWTTHSVSIGGVVVSMVAFQAVNPDSTPGWHTSTYLFNIFQKTVLADRDFSSWWLAPCNKPKEACNYIHKELLIVSTSKR